MAKKDRFQQMQQGGGVPDSFQNIVQQAVTVAAIEKQAEQPAVRQPVAPDVTQPAGGTQTASDQGGVGESMEIRFMRLPNPQIPIGEYNLVTRHCEAYTNMTRQDFVELAIIEKLHNEGLMPDGDYETRSKGIRSRPPRGHRKNTKNQSK